MIPRVYKYRGIDGKESFVCVDERQHDNFFHMYYWYGRRYTASGNLSGNFKMAVTDFNRLAKDGRITAVTER